jgi:hypothetical protein
MLVCNEINFFVAASRDNPGAFNIVWAVCKRSAFVLEEANASLQRSDCVTRGVFLHLGSPDVVASFACVRSSKCQSEM